MILEPHIARMSDITDVISDIRAICVICGSKIFGVSTVVV